MEKMAEVCKIIYEGGTGELVEKKSRFIAHIQPVGSGEEALAFVESVRKKYWDARHHCFAYITGERGQNARCSDDGEPPRTAGRPMLDVLEGEGLRDVCAVVTRYFGGMLLGTGGLVRAYQGAVKAGLRSCVVVEKIPGRRLEVTTDYNDSGKVQHLAAQSGIHTLDVQYTDKVVFQFLTPLDREAGICSLITEGANGRAQIRRLDEACYGLEQGKLIIF